jgi:type I restriction enzyme M protein
VLKPAPALSSEPSARSTALQPETRNIVAELWAACHVLRDDGLSSHDYVRELTYLLFLKLLQEAGQEHLLPAECRWSALAEHETGGLLEYYRGVLQKLGSQGDPRVRVIYQGSTTAVRSPSSLRHIVDRLNRSAWHDHSREGLGDAYEGLLERAAAERKSGAGQYFTPRPLVESVVAVMKPAPGETVLDPACGTAGFLISAAANETRLDGGPRPESRRFVGVELVHDVARLALMNFAVHGIEGDVLVGDSLYDDGLAVPSADVILSNPPFGTRGAPEMRFSHRVPIPTRNKQLAFLQLIVHQLRPGGRAAVVVPDNVLFESGVGEAVRTQLVEVCNLHTILRLPAGIFYAAGVKTNVVFMTRREEGASVSDAESVWIYDARSDMPIYGKRQPLTRGLRRLRARLRRRSARSFIACRQGFAWAASARSRSATCGPTPSISTSAGSRRVTLRPISPA